MEYIHVVNSYINDRPNIMKHVKVASKDCFIVNFSNFLFSFAYDISCFKI